MKEFEQVQSNVPDENETIDTNISFPWVDELGVTETKPQFKDNGHTFNRIVKLLADEKLVEEKILDEYLKRTTNHSD